MCVTVHLRRRGHPPRMVSGYGELRRLLGWRPPEAYRGHCHAENECLCGIDWQKLARLGGLRIAETPYDDDPMRVWLTDETVR